MSNYTPSGAPATSSSGSSAVIRAELTSIQTAVNSKQDLLVNSAGLRAALSDETGTGVAVFATSPTLVTPVLGVATATTINKITFTQPATGATVTITDGKTLSVSNTLTFTGTDASSVAFGTGGTVAYTANKLSAFAATSSAELAGVISDETGTGALVFANTPTLVTPTLGVATATSINKITFTQPAAGATVTVADGKTFTASNTLTLTATDGSTLAIGTGGTLGSAAYTATTAYAPAAGSTSITTLGTITTGTWNGSTVLAGRGGTGLFVMTLGDTLYAAATNLDPEVPFTWSKLPGNSTTTRKVMTQTGTGSASAAPAWNQLSASDILGTTTNDSAAAGYIGELISSHVPIASVVSLTSGVATDVTSISLTAGDWDVTGVASFDTAATTSVTSILGSISLTSATHPSDDGGSGLGPDPRAVLHMAAVVPAGLDFRLPLPTVRISITATTTVYLVASANFTVSTLGAFGGIRARRMR